MRYTLKFNCTVSFCADTSVPIDAEWIEESMAQFQDGSTWYNYLVSSHANCMENDGEGEEFPEISIQEIELSSPTDDGKFSGTISWMGPEAELEVLEEKLDWFIGDRMSFYEVNDEEEGWNCFVNPQGLTLAD